MEKWGCFKGDKFNLKLLVRGKNYEAETCLFHFVCLFLGRLGPSNCSFWKLLIGLNSFKRNEPDYRNKGGKSFPTRCQGLEKILSIIDLHMSISVRQRVSVLTFIQTGTPTINWILLML